MKVALVTPISLRSFGGAERKLVEAGKMLHELHHEVCIYSLPITHPGNWTEGARAPILENYNVEYKETKDARISADVAYVIYAPMIWRNFRLLCPMIAGLHSPLLFVSKDALVTFGNPWLTIKRYKSLRYMASFWLTRLTRSVDLASFSAVHVLNSCFGVQHKKTYSIPDWIDCSVFRPNLQKSDVFTVFFSGRHHWEKGFDTFVNVATILRKKGLKMRFLCTREGNGPVEGMGFLDDVRLAQAYSSSHLMVYPSRMDTFGGAIVEAAACGTPVVTTPLPSHMLGLPLIYASDLKEFTRSTMALYEIWRAKTGQYERIAATSADQAAQYSAFKIFPIFERMLNEVAVSRDISCWQRRT